jgi:hypothetical protein
LNDERERRGEHRYGKVNDPQRVVLSPATHERIEGQVVSTGKLEGKALGRGSMAREQQRWAAKRQRSRWMTALCG